ncbi:glycoside hydrolase family 9 protein [Cellulomonas soli]
MPCLPAGRALTADGVDLYEGWTDDHVLDVSGGWYDAGDQGKYVVNGGIAVAQLLGTHERLTARAAAGTTVDEAFLRALRAEARWELEWMLRMRVPAGSRYAGLVHHKVHDETWTPLPTLPHLDPRRRYLHRPSTAATLNLAAAAAQGARVLADHDEDFAAELLSAAREAYEAALSHPEVLAPDTNRVADLGGGPYDDTHLDDERYWAAAELYLSTGEDAYLADLRANPCHVDGPTPVFVPEGYDWKDLGALARIDLATVAGALPERDAVRRSVVAAAEELLATQAAQPFGTPYAPRDGRYDWGSTGLVANLLTVLLAAADVTGEDRFVHGALTGLGHLLGRNALGVSYVTGYGTRSVHHQHSRWYAGQLDPTLPDPPPGTLSGGPNSSTQDEVAAAAVGGLPPQRCFVDDIGAWSVNELTINWNAPLVQVAALLAYPGGRLD